MSLIYMSAVGSAARRPSVWATPWVAAILRIFAGRVGSGICLAGIAALPFALLLLFAPESVAALFGLDGEARRLTAATIQVAGLVVVIDALMGGNLGALRGASDVWLPFAIQSGAFWIVAVPLAAALGIGAGFGAPGLIYGILAGVTVSFALLALRFRAVARRAIAPL
jgi:MATE family multidrug resistance protein